MRAILEKGTLLSDNFDHFYYFLEFFSSFLGIPGQDYAQAEELDSLYQKSLL
jgi:hypothetical protein